MTDESNSIYNHFVTDLLADIGSTVGDDDGISLLVLETSLEETATNVVLALQSRDVSIRYLVVVATGSDSSSELPASITDLIPRDKIAICSIASAATFITTAKGSAVDAIIIDANTVCSNGDIVVTGQGIGSCNIALLASALDIPCYCIATTDKINVSVKSGDEALLLSEQFDDGQVWSPTNDVVPSKYVCAIVTEKGTIRKGDGTSFDLGSFMEPDVVAAVSYKTSNVSQEGGPNDKYQELTVDSLPLYVANHAPLAMKALGATSFVDLDCNQIEGGELNLLFEVINSLNGKKVVVKQALPYVKTAAEAWPIPLERAFYEYTALKTQKDACPLNVPFVYHFSKVNAAIIMEYIPLSCIALRKGLIGGIKFKTMASDMGEFCANTLFKTSGFKLSAAELREQGNLWNKNTSMCAIAERCVFTEPYIVSGNNRWTTPHLDEYKKTIEADTALKVAAAKLKHKFVTRTEALLHADLHTDSILCCPDGDQTYVIDPRFSFYGPMALDTGAFLANLLLSYVSQGGHANEEGYDEWVLEQIIIFWKTFRQEFLGLWDDPNQHTGYKFQSTMFGGGEDDDSFVSVQEDFLAELLSDTLGFAGMKMLRRIVGSNHVEDLESIENIDIKARCEIHGLEIAMALIKNSGPPNSIEDVVGLAREKKPSQ